MELAPPVGPVSVTGKLVRSPAGFVVFSMMIVPNFVLLNVQVTVSPTEREIVPIGLLSEHVAAPACQPPGSTSVRAYVPAGRLEKAWSVASVTEPLSLTGPVRLTVNDCGSPLGFVVFWTMMVPSCVFVMVQLPGAVPLHVPAGEPLAV
jgi:hypothetical protein